MEVKSFAKIGNSQHLYQFVTELSNEFEIGSVFEYGGKQFRVETQPTNFMTGVDGDTIETKFDAVQLFG